MLFLIVQIWLFALHSTNGAIDEFPLVVYHTEESRELSIQILVVQTTRSLRKWETPKFFGKDDKPTFFGVERAGVDFIQSTIRDVINQCVGVDAFVSNLEERINKYNFELRRFSYDLINKYSTETEQNGHLYMFRWDHAHHQPSLIRLTKVLYPELTSYHVCQFDGKSLDRSMVCAEATFKSVQETQQVQFNHAYLSIFLPSWAYDALIAALMKEAPNLKFDDLNGFDCDDIKYFKLPTYEFKFQGNSNIYRLTHANYFKESILPKDRCFLAVQKSERNNLWSLGGQFIKTYETVLWTSSEKKVYLNII